MDLKLNLEIEFVPKEREYYTLATIKVDSVSKEGRRYISSPATNRKLATGLALFHLQCDFEFVSVSEASNQLTFVQLPSR